MTRLTLATRLTPCAALVAAAAASPARAQVPATPPDSLRLGTLQQQAAAADPRLRQFTLLTRQTDLRLRNLSAEWLPAFQIEGQAQYQSDVFDAASLPVGTPFPTPARDTYDARLSVEQAILDLTIGPRRRVERARLAESEAEVRSALHALRHEVNEAFFAAALLAERGRIVAATIGELESRLREAAARVREGTALPGDTAAVRATLLERLQDSAEIEANRRAAWLRLGELIKQPLADSVAFAMPNLTAEAGHARGALPSLRVHPEYERLARVRDRLAYQEAAVSAAVRPRVSAFGRLGYGRPGLNPIGDRFDTYYVVGVHVRWAPWTWGRTGREREALAVQREIVATQEETLAGDLTRAIQGDLADADRLEAVLALDDRIVALRDQVENETRLRFQEGVVTAAEFLDRSTDALEARLARATHRVEHVRARARLLTTLGVEIR